MTDRLHDSAVLLASLVPGATTNGPSLDVRRVIALTPWAYERLSTCERATYELARDLWESSGPLGRFVLYADHRYADRLLSALAVALGAQLLPEVGER